MDPPFDAAAFFARLQAGEFDGRLYEVLGSLTREQLEQVAALMAESVSGKISPAGES